ncbi:hypothetical protein KA005_39270, partial [bacterium]|nr:hypothetical protein [bacterium]
MDSIVYCAWNIFDPGFPTAEDAEDWITMSNNDPADYFVVKVIIPEKPFDTSNVEIEKKLEVTETEEHTGGSSSYYLTHVANPTTLPEPYDAECNDIIEALDMTFAEGNAFKGIWRSCAARQGKK